MKHEPPKAQIQHKYDNAVHLLSNPSPTYLKKIAKMRANELAICSRRELKLKRQQETK